MSLKTDWAIHLMVEFSWERDKGMKKGSGRKFIKNGAQKRLWDDYFEFESYIRSDAAYGIYKLDGEVPEMIMSQKMSNISQFFEFEWFEGMMFWDEMAPYLDNRFKLGDTLARA